MCITALRSWGAVPARTLQAIVGVGTSLMPHGGAHRRLESDKGTAKADVSFDENDESIN